MAVLQGERFSSVSLQMAFGEGVLSLKNGADDERASRAYIVWAHKTSRTCGYDYMILITASSRAGVANRRTLSVSTGRAYPPASVACLFRVTGSAVRLWKQITSEWEFRGRVIMNKSRCQKLLRLLSARTRVAKGCAMGHSVFVT